MKYKDFQPTRFDAKGLSLPDQQDWIVAPCSRNRDSNCFHESNFHACLNILGGESDTCEVHRFGHWANGWFEIIIVSPERENEIEAIQNKLDNYPVLDEEDLSQRQFNAACDYWETCTLSERIEYLKENEESIFAARAKEYGELFHRAPRTADEINEAVGWD